MSGIIKIEIVESAAELRDLLKAAENQEVKERVQILYWLKTKQVETTQTIASLRRTAPASRVRAARAFESGYI